VCIIRAAELREDQEMATKASFTKKYGPEKAEKILKSRGKIGAKGRELGRMREAHKKLKSKG
jgi:hypothetical protein